MFWKGGHTHTHTHTKVGTHIHTHTHTRVGTHIHTHTHTHTHIGSTEMTWIKSRKDCYLTNQKLSLVSHKSQISAVSADLVRKRKKPTWEGFIGYLKERMFRLVLILFAQNF